MNKYVEKLVKKFHKKAETRGEFGTTFCKVGKRGKSGIFGTFLERMWKSGQKALTSVALWHIMIKPSQFMAHGKYILAQLT